jgi:hypothetical protein
MATMADPHDVLLTNIEEAAAESSKLSPRERATALLELAEARAWIMNPSQPHGGSASPRK